MNERIDLTMLSKQGIYCNRTLNLHSIKVIGYDMDYTLIHYFVEDWERRSFAYLKEKLTDCEMPVGDLEFDPSLVMRGLVIDMDLGNIVKANRFGFVKHASHGTKQLDYPTHRDIYRRTLIEPSLERFFFLNTLFSMSEGCMFAQLVDLMDEHRLPRGINYRDLFQIIHRSMNEAHFEGVLKGEIYQDPDRFVDLDPHIPPALMDQKMAGKKVLLITNSDWTYTAPMMSYAFDRFLPGDMTWRDLFDVVIVSARKPAFFSNRLPIFEVVTHDGLLRPVIGGIQDRGVYLGGCATMLEEHYGFDGEEFLYVGDHIFADVHASKSVLRWRTGLVVRELEAELAALKEYESDREILIAMMREKEQIEFELNRLRLLIQRKKGEYAEPVKESLGHLYSTRDKLLRNLETLDAQIATLAERSDLLMNDRWGPLMRAGNDKSYFARQAENYADIYMSRVSNFLHTTPFCYIRSPRSSLPHDLG